MGEELRSIRDNDDYVKTHYAVRKFHTGVSCPNCGQELQFMDNSILCSIPPRRGLSVLDVHDGFYGLETYGL